MSNLLRGVFLIGGLSLFAFAAADAQQIERSRSTVARLLLGNGSSTVPSLTFSSDTDLGLYRSAADVLGVKGDIQFGNNAAVLSWVGRSFLRSTADGKIQWANNGATAGIIFQFSAAPTVSSGFGTSPSISTGSTDSSGSVDVGTGGAASQGVIQFASTWSNAPFCVATVATTTAGNTRAMGASASTTQLTLTAASAWAASSVVSWHCTGR